MKKDRTRRTTTIEIGVASDIMIKEMLILLHVVDVIEVKGFQLALHTVICTSIFINARPLIVSFKTFAFCS